MTSLSVVESKVRYLGAMVARRIPVPKVGGSTPSGSSFCIQW